MSGKIHVSNYCKFIHCLEFVLWYCYYWEVKNNLFSHGSHDTGYWVMYTPTQSLWDSSDRSSSTLLMYLNVYIYIFRDTLFHAHISNVHISFWQLRYLITNYQANRSVCYRSATGLELMPLICPPRKEDISTCSVPLIYALSWILYVIIIIIIITVL